MTSARVDSAARSLYTSSGPRDVEVPTKNQRGRVDQEHDASEEVWTKPICTYKGFTAYGVHILFVVNVKYKTAGDLFPWYTKNETEYHCEHLLTHIDLRCNHQTAHMFKKRNATEVHPRKWYYTHNNHYSFWHCIYCYYFRAHAGSNRRYLNRSVIKCSITDRVLSNTG